MTNDVRNPDGSGNNSGNPALGQAGTQLLRMADADYGDGVASLAGEDRPDARSISNAVFAQSEPVGNEQDLSHYMWLWGQFLDHDLSLTEADRKAAEKADIKVPEGDAFFDPAATGTATIGLTRSIFDPLTGTGTDNPRQQINEVTPFIDASNIYGSSAERLDALRAESGKMAVSEGNLLPFNTGGLPNAPSPDSSLHLAGDVRANENLALTSMHTIFVREHNRLVDELAALHPDWNDDALFEGARKLVEAQLQIITYEEFLPKLLGPGIVGEWSGYRADVDPQITTEFSTAAFRIGHTMLASNILRTKEDGSEDSFGHLLLRDAFFQPDKLASEGGVDSILRGAAMAEAEDVDTMVIDDVRNFLFGPPGSGGFDLVSLNIQRGRDHGLADYNGTREAYGLDRVEGFADITSDVALQEKLEQLYGDVDNIDLFVGGLAEDTLPQGIMGELFATIIADQFTRVRDGDALWHEMRMTPEDMALLGDVSLASVIERNSDIEHMQDDLFTAYDRQMGTDADDDMTAESGHLLMMGMAGHDAIVGTDGSQQIDGGAGDDSLWGMAGDDTLDGGDGHDTLWGGVGNDILRGGSGDDTLFGEAGDDTLKGGAGTNTLYGGEGADTFVASGGHDVVLDFDTYEDTLSLEHLGDAVIGENLSVHNFEDGTLYETANGASIWLSGVLYPGDVNINYPTHLDDPDKEHPVDEPDKPLEDEEPDSKEPVTGKQPEADECKTWTEFGTYGDDCFVDDPNKQQYIFGEGGKDTFVIDGYSDDYRIEAMASGDGFIVWGVDSYDALWGVENVEFCDETIDLTDCY